MIDMLYSTGDVVWRESAIQVFSMNINTSDAKGKRTTLAGVVTVKENNTVMIFYKEGNTIQDCNDLIINSIGEINLLPYEIFATHTIEEFVALRDGNKKNTAEIDSTGVGISVTPPNETNQKEKDAKNAARRAKRAEKKEAEKVTPIKTKTTKK